jgi:Flp pilus assembly protein TadD
MIYSVQKRSGKAVEAYSAILAVQPDVWQALRGRGDAYLNLGKHAEAVADYEKALKLEPNDQGLLNNFAWVLATSPDDALRDGKRAVKLAVEACKAIDYKLAHVISTLAAAYAEIGDFDSAVKWATKAVELADKEQLADIKKELESYQAKKPRRERLSEEK